MQAASKELNVLLIDDDEDDFILIRDIFSEVLTPKFKIAWEKTYRTGLEAIRRSQFDVCLLDYRLDDRNGLELLEEAARSGCRSPIIVLTGQGDYEVDLRMMRAGATDYLVKDHLSAPLLERSIRYAIDRREKEEELRAHKERLERRTAELEQAKEELQKQKALFETILEQAVDGILVTDTKGVPIFVNEAAKRMAVREWQDHPFELYEAYWGKAYYPGGEPVPVEEWFIPKALRGEKTASREARMVRPDGSCYDLLISAAPLRKPEGAIIGVVSIFSDITDLKQTQEALRESERELRHLSTRLLLAHEEERKRIAHELHDSIGGSLGAIKLGLEHTLKLMENGQATAEGIEEIAEMTARTIEEARRIYMNLRPSILDDLGLTATISWFCRQFETLHSSIRIDRQVEAEEESIPEDLKIVIFRVMQEAFHNIAKYSKADLVTLSLRRNHLSIELAIEDNGVGFDVGSIISRRSDKGGLGLTSMRERVELSNGVFSIESEIGVGTVIHASWDGAQTC